METCYKVFRRDVLQKIQTPAQALKYIDQQGNS